MQLRQTEVAKRALECVSQAQADAHTFAEYGTRANSFPTMIIQAGLAQALGFLRAKSGTDNPLSRAYFRYYDDLVSLARVSVTDLPEGRDAFYERVISAELGEYRRLTQAVLDGAVWLKRIYQGTDSREGAA